MLELIARVAGTGRVALITDAIAAAGMDRGTYALGQQTVDIRDGAPRLADGTLAGSVLQMFRAVTHYEEAARVSRRDAVQSASLVPAKVLGLTRKGRIAAGCDGDLVVLNREDGVALTVARGEIVFQR